MNVVLLSNIHFLITARNQDGNICLFHQQRHTAVKLKELQGISCVTFWEEKKGKRFKRHLILNKKKQ